MTAPASRYELRNRQNDYVGTFVTGDRTWQIGDVLTTGDGRSLRIVGIAAVPQPSRGRPAFTGGLTVESVDSPAR